MDANPPRKQGKPERLSPTILAVKASAGAGKTHQLTIRFLTLLRRSAPTGQALRQIVAITFTNRAAAEMKDRIILSLKQMALATDEGRALSKEIGMMSAQAAEWLDIILKYFSDFQVRTIDSLIFTMMRAFALDMNLPPELEADFDREALLNRCFDVLLASVPWDDENDASRKLMADLLETYLRIERSSGMLVEKKIRERLTKLFEKAGESAAQNAEDAGAAGAAGTVGTGGAKSAAGPAGSAEADLAASEKNLRRAAAALLDTLKRSGLDECVAGNKCKLEYFESPRDNFDKAFWSKTSIGELLTKASAGFAQEVIDQADSSFESLKQARQDFCRCYAAVRIRAYVQVLAELRQAVRHETELEGIVLGGAWLGLVGDLLKSGAATGAYAFLRFGSPVEHFLIDEFQDTSPQQWRALEPLVEESLSVGGSLFYVGDVKQAIYGWRGGDWRLFPKIVKSEFPSVDRDSREQTALETNYRSLPEIVEFNNKVFGTLKDRAFAEKLAAIMMPKNTSEESLEELASTVSTNFADACQKISPKLKKLGQSGRVRVVPVAGEKDEISEAVHEDLIPEIKKAWERQKSGIAVLVRRNEDAEKIATWLVAEGIPIVTENSLRLKTSALIKGIVCLLHFLEYPLDDMAFWGTLRSPLFAGLPDIPLGALDAFTREGTWRSPLYRTLERELPDVSRRIIRPLLAASGTLAPYELVQEVTGRFDLVARVPEDAVFVHRFLEVVFQAEATGSMSLSRFLEFWDEGGMEEKIGLPDDVSAVRILTIHKAKGLEFPVVFIPFTNWMRRPRELAVTADGNLVWLTASGDVPLPPELEAMRLRSTLDAVIENLNLLYVATTRAREELHLYVTCLVRGDNPDKSYLAAWLAEMLAEAGLSDKRDKP